MYIAIEGIKGTGKSSVLAQIERMVEAKGIPYAMLRPYCLNGSRAVSDRLFRLTGNFWPDALVARFYARRSDRHAARIPKRCGLLIGDRSILTSYVTRWDESDPAASMSAVDLMERRIPVPDHVVLLEAPVEVALQRVRQRRRRGHGCGDEKPDRLAAAARAYRTMASHPGTFGLGGVRWHVVDASRPLDQVIADVLDIVLSLATSSFSTPTNCGATA
jgi:thymidylate kinase